MPDNTTLTPIQIAWLDFTKSVQILLVPQPDDRPLDQYLAVRDRVMPLVQGPKFLEELEKAWAPFSDHPKEAAGQILILELEAFSRAVEVAQATEKPESGIKSWIGKWLDRASTVTGSVNDIVDTLPYAKTAITLFKELLDIFKGHS